ncbi:MAG: uracil-DNA glycosylase [Pseudomonadota bacterium]
MDLDALDHRTLVALLAWQEELGATEAIGDAPVNRYEEPVAKPNADAGPVVKRAEAAPAAVSSDPVGDAETAAAAAQTLAELQAAMAAYPHCDLRLGARNLVFADGNPDAAVMIIGEAPGRDEDFEGRPFVGQAGQLLDRMLAAIGRDRAAPDADRAVYITNILPWRPPQNRDPKPEEIAMFLPFVKRHVALAAPAMLVLMGNVACQAILGRKGITRLRGTWTEALGLPCLPMFHPAYLLRNAHGKKDAWADLLALQDRARSLSTG